MNYATPATGKSHYQRGLKWGVLIISRNNFYLEGPVGTVAEPLSGHNHWIGHAINVNFIADAWKKCSDVFLNVVRVASRSNAVRSRMLNQIFIVVPRMGIRLSPLQSVAYLR
jgi:hypothetical protein